MNSKPLKIWFVDDLPENRRAWLDCFSPELRAQHRFDMFATVEDLFAAFEIEMPDILFIDYFIGPRYGHEVLAYFDGRAGASPVLIAHSSDARANRGMLKIGADLSVAKIKGAAYRRIMLELIRSEEDLFALIARYR